MRSSFRHGVRALALLALQLPSTILADDLEILYIRAEFSDKAIGISDNLWRNRLTTLNSRLDGYWSEHSYESITSIRATYTPRLLFPEPSGNYLDIQKVRRDIRTLAMNAGFNVNSFDHVVYSYPSIPSNFPGGFGALGSPGNIWLPGNNPFDGGLIHEFGHALGVGHSNAIEGAAGVVYPGQKREGRDGLYMMGSDGNGRIGDYSTINLPMRYDMGFVDDRYLPQASGNQTYRIWEHEIRTLPSVRNLGVRVDVNGEDFWVTFAPTMVSRWANFNSAGFARGVIVHRKDAQTTAILDFTPGSFQGTPNEVDFKDTRDGALQIGQSFQFPSSSVSLRPLSIGSSNGIRYIDVEINTNTATGSFAGTARNIGITGGSTTTSGDRYTIRAGGNDIWNTADQFHYYSRQANSGNVELSARVDSLTNTNAWAKAGVMLRQNTSAGSRHVSVFVRPDGQVAMQWRANANQNSSWASPLRGGSGLPKFVRLVKNNNQITGSFSLNGTNWTNIQTITVNLGNQPEVGLAVTSHNTNQVTNAVFSQVKATNGNSGQQIFRYDFGTSTSPLAAGYTRVTATTTTGPIFWTSNTSNRRERDRGSSTATQRDFVFGTANATLRHTLPNGTWEVAWTLGDANHPHTQNGVKAEGVTRVSGVSTARNEFVTRTFQVDVNDGNLDLEFFDGGGSDLAWLVNSLVYTKVSTPSGPSMIQLDFGTPSSPLQSGYQRISPNTISGPYRWADNSSLASRDRNTGNNLNRDFIFSSQPHTFLIDLPNGTWQATITLGDFSARHDDMVIKAEGNTVKSGITRELGVLSNEVFNVTVNDGTLDLEFSDGGGTDANWVINRVKLERQ